MEVEALLNSVYKFNGNTQEERSKQANEVEITLRG